MKSLCILKNYVIRALVSRKNVLLLPYSLLLFTLLVFDSGIAQEYVPYQLGNEKEFSYNLLAKKSSSISLQISESEALQGVVNLQDGTMDSYSIAGSIQNEENAFFNISKSNGIVKGQIVLYKQKRAFEYYSNDTNEIMIKETDINKVLCIDLKKVDNKEADQKTIMSKRLPDLQSLPGAVATVYLDFDGEVVSGTRWAGGATINAVPSGFSDEKITNIWRIMAEDFRPFNINITTNRDIFEAAPVNRRMMCIFTSTDTAAPGSGGVAFLNSFSSNRNDDPCWAYNSSTRSAGETGSHEVGHTLGLSHDGVPGNQYYAGHGDWSPIMGWSVSKPIGHWSKGEYNNATTNQDDLAIISSDRNGFGYKQDDHGNTLTEASEIVVNATGEVNATQNAGIISIREDKDVFSFITSGGEIKFDIEPDPFYPNLNIEAKIINAQGEEIEISSPTRDLSASISATVAGGTYFLQIDGVGEGNLSTGYSDYSSIGAYTISGSYAPGNNNQPPVANFESTNECDKVSFTSTSINAVNTYLWDFGDGTTSTLQNPDHVYTQNGTYTVSLTVTNDIGANTKENSIDIAIASLPQSLETTACNGASTTINVSGSNGYLWYEQPDDTTIIATGSSFVTPELTATTTYYVSGTTKPITTAAVGIENISPNDGRIHQGGFSLLFDAEEPILLKTATIAAEGSGNRTLELKNASGDILISKEINIPDGENTVDINITIPKGTNMEIGFTENANLFRSDKNVNYPYEVSDIVSIKRSTAGNDPETYYYYLYNWEITTLGECETTERAEVTVTVADAPETPTISLDANTNEITVAQQFTAYQWYLDNQPIDGATNATLIADREGTYTLEAFNEDGCSSFSENIVIDTLSITDVLSPIESIIIYPNPVNEILYINGLDGIKDKIQSLKIVNTLGQVISTYDNSFTELDTSNLAEGLYFLVLNNKTSKKFIKTY